MSRVVQLFKRTIASVIAGFVVITMFAAAPAHANDEAPPIAGDVTITVYPGTFRTIDITLMEATSDPKGQHLWICGVKNVEELYYGNSSTFTSLDENNELVGYTWLEVYQDVTAESVSLKYCVTNGTHVTWGNLTIDVVYPSAPTVSKTIKANGNVKRGNLTVVNPNNDTLQCGFGSFAEYDADVWVNVAPNSSLRVPVTRHRIDWACFIGTDWAYLSEGTVRGIKLPAGTVPGVGSKRTTPMGQFWAQMK